MSRRIVFRPAAGDELSEARDWYEARREKLGGEFVAECDEVIARIAERPELYPRVRGEVRRAVLRRFPYAVYYRVLDNVILVLAVVHGHRHPRVWRSRR